MNVTSRYVRPLLSTHNQADGRLTDVVLARQNAQRVAIGAIPSANGAHGFFGQFRHAVRLTPRSTTPRPALSLHVFEVANLCSQEQVFRPHARRGIAGVADDHPCRDRPVRQYPRGPVSRFDSATEAHMAVASLPPASGPQPASIGLLNLCPESFRLRPSGRLTTRSATEARGAFFQPSQANDKARPALFTRSLAATLALHSIPPVSVPSPRPFTRRGGTFVPTIVPRGRWDPHG